MLFPEADASLLKAWVVKRLANTSDADSDVLADYVLALLRHDGDAESIRKLFEDEMPDFLGKDSKAFVDDVFQAVAYRSYLPGAPLPPPLGRPPSTAPPTLSAQAPPFVGPTSSQSYIGSRSYPAPPASGLGSGSKKRGYDDRNDPDMLGDSSPNSSMRVSKQARRTGGFNTTPGRFDGPNWSKGRGTPFQIPSAHEQYGPPGYANLQGQERASLVNSFTNMPQNTHGMNQIDPRTIMENIRQLQELGIPIPRISDTPRPVYSGSTPSTRRRRPRCRDYDTKGFCSRGSNCKFDHGSDTIYIPPIAQLSDPSAPPLFAHSDGESVLPSSQLRTAVTERITEYDPNNAAIDVGGTGNDQPMADQQTFLSLDLSALQMIPKSHKRREPKKPKRRGGRSVFAGEGPNHDQTKTKIVVENIPEDNFSEDQIREFFSQFGTITKVSLTPFKQIATVDFDSWEAADAAWRSPKVVFDNRFVKIYWHKDEADHGNGFKKNKRVATEPNGSTNGHSSKVDSAPNDPEFDMEEFLRKQEEAQKAYEEKTKKKTELELERQALEEKRRVLVARQRDEKRRLQEKLASSGLANASASAGSDLDEVKPTTQTEVLRAQLAALEEEATELGLDPNAPPERNSHSWAQGQRPYRGRGGFPSRGFRGAYNYRGRGGGDTVHAAYAAYSIDNRPRTVAISGVDFTVSEKDEALRQYLFGIGEFTDIDTDPSATRVTFKDRKTAEKFMFGLTAHKNVIPGVQGELELSWIHNPGPAKITESRPSGDAALLKGAEDGHPAAAKESLPAEKPEQAEEGEIEEGEAVHNVDEIQDMDYETVESGW